MIQGGGSVYVPAKVGVVCFFLPIVSMGARKMLINGHSSAYLKSGKRENNDFSCQVTWRAFS